MRPLISWIKDYRSFALACIIAALFILSGNPRLIAQGMSFVGTILPGTIVQPGMSSPGDTTSGIYFATNRVGVSGHFETGAGTGDTPAVSTCGTSAALATGSTDHAGKITVGTSASNACTLTFGTAYTAAPFCVVQNKTTGAAANVYTVSTTAIVWSSALADSSELFYNCTAPSGG